MNGASFKVPLITSFLRYNASAYTATICDYLSYLVFIELFNIYYPIGAFMSGVVGATVAFLLGRNWTFNNKDVRATTQSVRFVLVVAGSIMLNVVGTYLVTEYMGIDKKISKIVVAVMVGACYNFPMQRYFVFR